MIFFLPPFLPPFWGHLVSWLLLADQFHLQGLNFHSGVTSGGLWLDVPMGVETRVTANIIENLPLPSPVPRACPEVILTRTLRGSFSQGLHVIGEETEALSV